MSFKATINIEPLPEGLLISSLEFTDANECNAGSFIHCVEEQLGLFRQHLSDMLEHQFERDRPIIPTRSQIDEAIGKITLKELLEYMKYATKIKEVPNDKP